MGAPASRMGAGGPIAYLIGVKKAFNPQIGSGGAMRASLGGPLELLLELVAISEESLGQLPILQLVASMQKFITLLSMRCRMSCIFTVITFLSMSSLHNFYTGFLSYVTHNLGG
jgi:hypothetical protein